MIDVRHIIELRSRVNDLRAARGLPAVSFVDSPLLLGTVVKTAHIAELRSALSEVYADAGQTPPVYTDPELVAGQTVVKSAHVMELRDAVARQPGDASHRIEFTNAGPSGTPVTYQEYGFTIEATGANWRATSVPSLSPPVHHVTFQQTVTGQVRVTDVGGAPFRFRSVDLYASISTIPYSMTGRLNSEVVFVVQGELGRTTGTFGTVDNPHYRTSIDSLTIQLTNVNSSGNPMGLDNIALNR